MLTIECAFSCLRSAGSAKRVPTDFLLHFQEPLKTGLGGIYFIEFNATEIFI